MNDKYTKFENAVLPSALSWGPGDRPSLKFKYPFMINGISTPIYINKTHPIDTTRKVNQSDIDKAMNECMDHCDKMPPTKEGIRCTGFTVGPGMMCNFAGKVSTPNDVRKDDVYFTYLKIRNKASKGVVTETTGDGGDDIHDSVSSSEETNGVFTNEKTLSIGFIIGVSVASIILLILLVYFLVLRRAKKH